jgi:hypothetical protein
LFTDEARLIDIAFPVGIVLYNQDEYDSFSSHTCAVQFSSTTHHAALKQFYHYEMERLGWKSTGIFSTTDQVVLVFEKPHKMCVVTIKIGLVELFVGPKN